LFRAAKEHSKSIERSERRLNGGSVSRTNYNLLISKSARQIHTLEVDANNIKEKDYNNFLIPQKSDHNSHGTSANILHRHGESESNLNTSNPNDNLFFQSTHHYFNKMDVPGASNRTTHNTPIINKFMSFERKKLSHDPKRNKSFMKDLNRLNLEEAMNLAHKIADDFTHIKKNAHKKKSNKQKPKNQIVQT
jgi:hypothetical protein